MALGDRRWGIAAAGVVATIVTVATALVLQGRAEVSGKVDAERDQDRREREKWRALSPRKRFVRTLIPVLVFGVAVFVLLRFDL